jgi:hypothetical protein
LSDSVTEDSVSQFLLSFRVADNEKVRSPNELVKHAVIRRETLPCIPGTDIPVYQYRCGKLGPASSLTQILKDISTIVSAGLRFEPVVPPALPCLEVVTAPSDEATTGPELSSYSLTDSITAKREKLLSILDCNSILHRKLIVGLPSLLSSVSITPKKSKSKNSGFGSPLENNEKQGLNNDDDSSVGGTMPSDSDSDSDSGIPMSPSGGQQTGSTAPTTEKERFRALRRRGGHTNVVWALREKEGDFRDVFASLLRSLAYKRFLVQSVDLLFLQEISRRPLESLNSGNVQENKDHCLRCSFPQEISNITQVDSTSERDPLFWRLFQSLLLPALHHSALFYSAQSLLSLPIHSICSEYSMMFKLSLPILSFVSRGEDRLWRGLIVPPLSQNIVRECREKSGLSWFFANTYRDRESLIVESLLQRLFCGLKPKAIKKDREKEILWVVDCVETEEFLTALSQCLMHLDEVFSQQLSSPRSSHDIDGPYSPVKRHADFDSKAFGNSNQTDDVDTLEHGERKTEEDIDIDDGKGQQQLSKSFSFRGGLRSQRLFHDERVAEALKHVSTPLDRLFHSAELPMRSLLSQGLLFPSDMNEKAAVPVPHSVRANQDVSSFFRNYEDISGTTLHDKKTIQLLSITQDLLSNSRFPFYPYTTAHTAIAHVVSASTPSVLMPHSEDATRSGSNNLSVDMAQRVITLFYRHKALRQVVKSNDIAFLSSSSFYKFVDPWEVSPVRTDNINGNNVNGRDSVLLGRRSYRLVRVCFLFAFFI